jgi:hypothetical protein
MAYVRRSVRRSLPAELYAATVLIDEDFADLLEDPFLDGLIDGKTEDLAYIWLSVNHVGEQWPFGGCLARIATHTAGQGTKGYFGN